LALGDRKMIIKNDEELACVTKKVSELLQAIHNYLGDRNCEEAKIKFPRGYIRKCVNHRKRYSFIKDKTLRSNIAYALLTTDIFRWLLNRTDLAIVAKEMLIKQGIVIFGAIAEAITKYYLRGKPGGGKSFKKRVEVLQNNGIIDESLRRELEWLWDCRNRIHLMLLNDKEYGHYEIIDYNRAVKALNGLRIALGGKP